MVCVIPIFLHESLRIIYSTIDDASSVSSAASDRELDPDDPMAAYFRERRREEKALKKNKSFKSSKHIGETPEERRARKKQHKEKKMKKQKASSSGLQGVKAVLQKWGENRLPEDRSGSTSAWRNNESRSARIGDSVPARRQDRSRSHSPRMFARGGYRHSQERPPSPMEIDRRPSGRPYRNDDREERT